MKFNIGDQIRDFNGNLYDVIKSKKNKFYVVQVKDEMYRKRSKELKKIAAKGRWFTYDELDEYEPLERIKGLKSRIADL